MVRAERSANNEGPSCLLACSHQPWTPSKAFFFSWADRLCTLPASDEDELDSDTSRLLLWLAWPLTPISLTSSRAVRISYVNTQKQISSTTRAIALVGCVSDFAEQSLTQTNCVCTCTTVRNPGKDRRKHPPHIERAALSKLECRSCGQFSLRELSCGWPPIRCPSSGVVVVQRVHGQVGRPSPRKLVNTHSHSSRPTDSRHGVQV